MLFSAHLLCFHRLHILDDRNRRMGVPLGIPFFSAFVNEGHNHVPNFESNRPNRKKSTRVIEVIDLFSLDLEISSRTSASRFGGQHTTYASTNCLSRAMSERSSVGNDPARRK
jgi:hypothetical protein